MDDREAIRREVEKRRISRLCHFTQARKLPYILGNPEGVLSTKLLMEQSPDVANYNDPHRLDGYLDYVCCSVEYPNSWYLNRVKKQDPVFQDWVILFIDPSLVWREGTSFCPRNAAASFGRHVVSGYSGFLSLFRPLSRGAYGFTYRRAERMLECCPTDGQAEVLVHRNVPRNKILAVAVGSRGQLIEERNRLRFAREFMPDVVEVPWVVCPHLFDNSWRDFIERGERPPEEIVEVSTNE